MTNVTLSTLIQNYDAALSNQEVAEAILVQLRVENWDIAERILLPIVTDEVRRRRRQRTAAIEAAPVTSADPLADRKRLMAESFFVEGYGLVPWGEATVEQHQARVAALRVDVVGLRATIRRHEQAIAEIQTAGVRCLAEVGRKEPAWA